MFNNIANIILQNNATTTGNGTEYDNSSNGADSITFEISGTSSSKTIIFEGASLSGTYYPIQCVNLSTLAIDTQTTGNSEIWQVSLEGIDKFRTRISAINGGNVTIIGKVVGKK